jgi:hypothetical protein
MCHLKLVGGGLMYDVQCDAQNIKCVCVLLCTLYLISNVLHITTGIYLQHQRVKRVN